MPDDLALPAPTDPARTDPAPTDAGLTAVPRRRRPGLPPEVLAGLREAFADEVGQRVPRLCRLSRPVPGRDVVVQALRDIHTLAGSAVVLGELEAARCARELELALEDYLRDPARPLPAAVPDQAERLAALLDGWLAP